MSSTVSPTQSPLPDKNNQNDKLLEAAKFLRFKSSMKTSDGVFMERRVNVFKAVNAVETLLKHKTHRSLAEFSIEQETDAINLLQRLQDVQLTVKLEREPHTRNYKKHPRPKYEPECYYVFSFHSSRTLLVVYSVLCLMGTLLVVLYPIWPYRLKRSVYYLMLFGIFLVFLLLVISVFRVIFYAATLLLGCPIWILPNLWEDVSFVDSFKPCWDHAKPNVQEKTKEE